MAKVRSPNYPSLNLADAIEAIRPVLKAEHRNKMSREVLARHMGYTSLNGRALGKIGAIRAYGLIDGSGDELRVSDDAVHALMAPEGSPERAHALARCALKPSLFQDIRADFPHSLPSESNLRYWLVKNHFTADAAGKAAESYLSTMRLVDESPTAYPSPPIEQEPQAMNQSAPTDSAPIRQGTASEVAPPQGMRKAVFPLSEGDVTLLFPAGLSEGGYQELSDYLEIFLRKAKRESQRGDIFS